MALCPRSARTGACLLALQNALMLWMICYDISDDTARRRVESLLSAVGGRVQWSVFECVLSRSRLAVLRRAIADELDFATDSVRYYPLCTWCDKRVTWQGQGRRTDDPDLWLV